MTDLKSKLVEIVADHLEVPPADVTDDADFVKDLKADSLDTVELIMRLEQEFGIDVPDDEAEKMTSLGGILDYLNTAVA
jgi:acyl carrier protein